MLVNENRLNLADQRARNYLVEQMERSISSATAPMSRAGYVPPVD
jgi:Fe-S cluster biosynthesis and repair protein YggX